MAYSSRGEIRWTGPEVRRMAAPKPHLVRLGAAGGMPPPGGTHTVESNTKFYLGLCRQAADKGVDLLVCLENDLAHYLEGGRPLPPKYGDGGPPACYVKFCQ